MNLTVFDGKIHAVQYGNARKGFLTVWCKIIQLRSFHLPVEVEVAGTKAFTAGMFAVTPSGVARIFEVGGNLPAKLFLMGGNSGQLKTLVSNNYFVKPDLKGVLKCLG